MPTVTLRAPGIRCSGSLISADLTPRQGCTTDVVLTCAHFFRTAGPTEVRGRGFRRKVVEVRTVKGTDIAVCFLDSPAPPRDLPRVAAEILPIGRQTMTYGMAPRAGRALLRLPAAASKSLTIVCPAQLLLAPARKGDSGGAVVAGHAIYGVQSLILPIGELVLCTIASTASHWQELRRLAKR